MATFNELHSGRNFVYYSGSNFCQSCDTLRGKTTSLDYSLQSMYIESFLNNFSI